MHIIQENDMHTDSFVKLRLKLSVSLYYKLLESIMKDEERRNSALQVYIVEGGRELVFLKNCS